MDDEDELEDIALMLIEKNNHQDLLLPLDDTEDTVSPTKEGLYFL